MTRFTEMIMLQLILLIIEQAFASSPLFLNMPLSEFTAILRGMLEQEAGSSNEPDADPNNSGLFNFSEYVRHASFAQANDQQSSEAEHATSSRGKQIEDPLVPEQTDLNKPIHVCSLDCSENGIGTSNKTGVNLKRKSRETNEYEGIIDWSDEVFHESTLDIEERVQEVYNIWERRHRDIRIIESLRDLKELIPDCAEVDTLLQMMQQLSLDHMEYFSPYEIGYEMGMMDMASQSLVSEIQMLVPIHFHGMLNPHIVYFPSAEPSSSEAHSTILNSSNPTQMDQNEDEDLLH